MPGFSAPAIILRRVEYGDDDLILSYITFNKGKISAIAKSAKKSVKRFAGILEPFSVLEIVCTTGKKGGRLPILQEAVLKRPFSRIRSDFNKTAYASYWAELINEWVEEGSEQPEIYLLFRYCLEALDDNVTSESALSILFQMRFIAQMGYGPNLTHCSMCKQTLEDISANRIVFDIKRGGILCNRCELSSPGNFSLSKGTIKQLLWIKSGNLDKAKKIRPDTHAENESLVLLEAFISYHLGKSLRSLDILRNLRSERNP